MASTNHSDLIMIRTVLHGSGALENMKMVRNNKRLDLIT